MPTTPLDRERIVAAALAIVDAGGVDRLSMRRLARALGAGPMSLYRHVANKDELLRLVAQALADRLTLPPASASWDETVTAVMRSIRGLLVEHPAIVTMVSDPSIFFTPTVLQAIDAVLLALLEAGLEPSEAALTFAGLWTLTLGEGVEEQYRRGGSGAAERHHVAAELGALAEAGYAGVGAAAPHWAAADDGDAYLLTLGLLLDGVRARVAASSSDRPGRAARR